MLDESATSLQEIIRQVDQYPEEAFLFVRDGLSYAVERVHGPASQAHYLLARYIEQV